MSVFTAKCFRNHEQVLFHQDPASGLRAIIAIHDTTLGPGPGRLPLLADFVEEVGVGTDRAALVLVC